MMLKHAREPVDGQPVENTFLAIDEYSGAQLGACTIYQDDNPALYPARPLQVRLQLEGSPIPDALLGAAVARGREICNESGSSAGSTPAATPTTRRCWRASRPWASRTTTAWCRCS